MENKKQEYNKMYYQKNKERLSAKRKERYKVTSDEYKQKRKEYYQKNKDSVLSSNKEWREKNRERFTKMVNIRRKVVAQELKKQGQMYVYLPRTERENKMVTLLSNKIGYPEDECREMLIKNNWNIKSILEAL